MNTINIGSKSGGICIIESRATPRQLMLDATTAAGVQKYVPAEPPQSTALREAMGRVARTYYKRIRNQPLVARQVENNSYECCRVIPQGIKNEHRFLFSAEIKDWVVRVLDVNTQEYMTAMALIGALNHTVNELRTILPTSVVSRVVVRALQKWNAVPMSENGGVWFIGHDHIEEYRAMASVLSGKNTARLRLTVFDIDANPETAGDVLDKVRAAVTAGVKELEDDIANATDGFSDRSIKVRLARADRLLATVNEYQNLMGIDMPELTAAIEQAKQSVAIHKLLSVGV